MSWILKDLKCSHCNNTEEILVRQGEKVSCTKCGSTALKPLPAFAAVHGGDSFNPHYDWQMGKFFESKEQKEKTLASMGRVQLSGNPSPKKSTKDRIIMTKTQAERGLQRRELLHSSRTYKPNKE